MSKNAMHINTVTNSGNFSRYESTYQYQSELTNKLDRLSQRFNQNIVNEIVLWKTNRFASISRICLRELNKISNHSTSIDEEQVRKTLSLLLQTHGIDLAMASAILRFKNPKLFQMIDQRAYRFVYGVPLKRLSDNSKKISMYLLYLESLRQLAAKHNLNFERMDRILYEADRNLNTKMKLRA